jgi:hypothetical protein
LNLVRLIVLDPFHAVVDVTNLCWSFACLVPDVRSMSGNGADYVPLMGDLLKRSIHLEKDEQG